MTLSNYASPVQRELSIGIRECSLSDPVPVVFLVDLGSKKWERSSTSRSAFGSRIWDIPYGIGCIEGRKLEINVSNFCLKDKATWISFFHGPNPSLVVLHWHTLRCFLVSFYLWGDFYFKKLSNYFVLADQVVVSCTDTVTGPADLVSAPTITWPR